MVVTTQLNIFLAKGEVSPYFSPHVLLTKTDLDYDKHLKIPFGTYVQAFHEETPKNTNAPRTLDAIYLRPTHNKQGGHELMNLNTGKLITRPKVWAMPVTDLVIKAVEAMAKKDGIKSLKLTNHNKTIIYPSDWIAGVDYVETSDDESSESSDEDYTYESDSDSDSSSSSSDSDSYDSDEDLEDIVAEPGQNRNRNKNANPIMNAEEQVEEQAEEQAAELEEQVEEEQQEPEQVVPLRRSTRGRVAEPITYFDDPQRPSEDTRHVLFADQKMEMLEQSHNIITDNSHLTEEYTPQMAMILARLIIDINAKATSKGASFAQQYPLQKGLKLFKERGVKATTKELDQLIKRVCFTPISIAEVF